MSGRRNNIVGAVGAVEAKGGALGAGVRSDTGTTETSAVDLTRYRAALAAADDPELVLGPVTDAFSDLHELVCAGDQLAASGAAIAVQDLCLQACVGPAASAEAADDKVQVLTIILRWAWPRAPATAAVLEAARAQELQRWGGEVRGRA